MTVIGWLQIIVFALAVLAHHEAARRVHVPGLRGRASAAAARLRPVERVTYRALRRRSARGADLDRVRVRAARLQRVRRAGHLSRSSGSSRAAAEPAGASPRSTPHLAFNTAASFTTNTNWQSYAGETTMSYLTQMVALASHNFISAAVGIAVALALIRGLSRRARRPKTLGNFWVDLVRVHALRAAADLRRLRAASSSRRA